MSARKHKPADDTARLRTEQFNPATKNLDRLSSLSVVRAINAEDARVAAAVKGSLPQVARAVDMIADGLSEGGRLIYVGTGTSGRLGALDAVECPPTFSTDPGMVQFLIAGGVKALSAAVESNEDSREDGRRDMATHKPGKHDTVVGIAASGRTPYTVAALEYARAQGAQTVAVVCNRGTALERAAEVAVVADVGPEAVSGSTRMKAGTAQKMILNMLSTGAMARLGYIYGNLMVNLRLTNSKLVQRGIRILQQATGLDSRRAKTALKKADGSVPVAIVMVRRGITCEEAQELLQKARGSVRRALAL